MLFRSRTPSRSSSRTRTARTSSSTRSPPRTRTSPPRREVSPCPTCGLLREPSGPRRVEATSARTSMSANPPIAPLRPPLPRPRLTQPPSQSRRPRGTRSSPTGPRLRSSRRSRRGQSSLTQVASSAPSSIIRLTFAAQTAPLSTSRPASGSSPTRPRVVTTPPTSSPATVRRPPFQLTHTPTDCPPPLQSVSTCSGARPRSSPRSKRTFAPPVRLRPSVLSPETLPTLICSVLD